MLELLQAVDIEELGSVLTTKLAEFGIDGRFQWRVSGKYWQKMFPEFFVSTKQLSARAFPKTVPWLSAARWLEDSRATD